MRRIELHHQKSCLCRLKVAPGVITRLDPDPLFLPQDSLIPLTFTTSQHHSTVSLSYAVFLSLSQFYCLLLKCCKAVVVVVVWMGSWAGNWATAKKFPQHTHTCAHTYTHTPAKESTQEPRGFDGGVARLVVSSAVLLYLLLTPWHLDASWLWKQPVQARDKKLQFSKVEKVSSL